MMIDKMKKIGCIEVVVDDVSIEEGDELDVLKEWMIKETMIEIK